MTNLSRRIFLTFLFLLLAALANAQYIPVTGASCITDGAGSSLASGNFIAQATDANGNAIPFRVGGGGQSIVDPIVWTITSGSLPTGASIKLADPSLTSPLNIRWHIGIKDTTTGKTTNYPNVNIAPNDVLVSGSYTKFNWCLYNTGLSIGTIPATVVSGPGFQWRGVWSSSTAYATNNGVLDVVSYLGSSYAAVGSSTNVIPGTDSTKWQVMFQSTLFNSPGWNYNSTTQVLTIGSAASGAGEIDFSNSAWTHTIKLHAPNSFTADPDVYLPVVPGNILVDAQFAPSATTDTTIATNITSGTLNIARLNLNAPAWLKFLGDGSEGAYSCPSGTCGLGGEHWYTTVNIAAGATVLQNVSSGAPIIIHATGACTVAGSIVESPTNGSFSAYAGTFGNYGGGGGGGGGGTLIGTAGVSAAVSGSGGTAGASSGGNAGNGSTVAAQFFKYLLENGPVGTVTGNINFTGGSTGGAGGSSGGAAGKGGGLIALICQSINFTGTLDVRGSTGGNSTGNNVGPGGGGGGGIVITSAQSYVANTGSILLTGGSGGSCLSFTGCGTAGSGASGNSYQVTVQ